MNGKKRRKAYLLHKEEPIGCISPSLELNQILGAPLGRAAEDASHSQCKGGIKKSYPREEHYFIRCFGHTCFAT